ncbi:hypothetical protein [Staphylococcus phage vB_StaM_PB50]|nr:hypothetical protein [Staphylococcus phage vB_StaM_PB50]
MTDTIKIIKTTRGFQPQINGVTVLEVVAKDKEGLDLALSQDVFDLTEAIERQFHDEENNFGLLFHMAGADGRKQEEVFEFFEGFDVDVF